MRGGPLNFYFTKLAGAGTHQLGLTTSRAIFLMNPEPATCVLLAERHSGLTEGIRGLIASMFDVVVMVADEVSLLGSAKRLRPAMAVVDLSLTGANATDLLIRLHAECPDLKVVLLSVHDEPAVARYVLEAGAAGCVLKRNVADDLLPAVEAILGGSTYTSPGFYHSVESGKTAR